MRLCPPQTTGTGCSAWLRASPGSAETTSTFTLIERYDWEGTLRVKSYPHPDDDADVEVFIRGEWGEAGVGLTASEARALARELVEAVGATESDQ